MKNSPIFPIRFAHLGKHDTPLLRTLPWKISTLLIASILTFVAAGCRPSGRLEATSAKWTREQAELIRQAGERLGGPVRTERMAYFAQANTSCFAASAANLEKTPSTELPNGVNLGVAYLDLPGQKFPKGFYKIRAVADAKQVGRVEGKGQLINDKGEVVGELPATIEVRSMTLPEPPGSQLTRVTFCTGAACNIAGGTGTPPIAGFWVCYACTNGFTVCIHLSLHDLWDLME